MMVSHEMRHNIQTEGRTNLVEASNTSTVEYDNQHSKAEGQNALKKANNVALNLRVYHCRRSL